jgi:hypothetical protein
MKGEYGTMVNGTDGGKSQGTRRKARPSGTLSTTNITLTDLGSKPGLRCKKAAANRLNHGITHP